MLLVLSSTNMGINELGSDMGGGKGSALKPLSSPMYGVYFTRCATGYPEKELLMTTAADHSWRGFLIEFVSAHVLCDDFN